MITSVPTEIIQLGLDHQDYNNIARNINRILNMPENWDSILERAKKELSNEVTEIALKIPLAMAYDREFFKITGYPYSNGPPVQGCFITSLADYLLRNKEKLQLSSSKI